MAYGTLENKAGWVGRFRTTALVATSSSNPPMKCFIFELPLKTDTESLDVFARLCARSYRLTAPDSSQSPLNW